MPDSIFEEGGESVTLAEVRHRCCERFPGCENRATMTDGVEFIIAAIPDAGIDSAVKVGGEYATFAEPPKNCVFVYEEHDPKRNARARAAISAPDEETGVDAYAIPVIDMDHPNARTRLAHRNEILNLLTVNGTAGFALIKR